MTRRNSPRDIKELEDLNNLDRIVVDKRLGQRSLAKKGRRNRHYEKQFIRNALTLHNGTSESQPPDPNADLDPSPNRATAHGNAMRNAAASTPLTDAKASTAVELT